MEKANSLQAGPSRSMEIGTLELKISKKRLVIIYIIIGILFLIPNLFTIFWSIGWDDSIYMGAIRMVLDGKLPYRDFYWYHTPGFLYLNSLIAYIFKLDLIPLRLLSFAFGLSGMILLGFISYRLGGHMGSIIALTLSATTFHNGYLSAIYFISMTNFFLLASLVLQIYLKDGYFKIFLITGALFLSFSIRSTSMICIVGYGIFLLSTKKKLIKKLLSYSLSIVIFSSLVYGFFLVSAPNELIIGLSSYRIKVYPSWGISFNLPRQIFHFFYNMSEYPVLFIGMISMVLFSWFDKKKNMFNFAVLTKSENKEKWCIALVSLLLILLASFEIIFVPYTSSGHILFYFPLMAILIAWYYKSYLTTGLYSPKEIRRLTILLIAISIFVSYFSSPMNLFVAIRTMKKEYHYSSTKQIKMLSAEIKKMTNPNDKIFTFNPIFAVYAGRSVLSGLETGYSAYSPNWNSDEIKRYHVFNFQKIKEWLQTKSASIVIITDVDKKIYPFREKLSTGTEPIFWKDFNFYLNQNYQILFIKKIDDYFWGNAFVYIPKKDVKQ